MENVQLVTTPVFKLTNDELHQLYIRLALCQYQYLRNPNYKEKVLIAKLTADFKKINIELNQLMAQNPNNQILHQITYFFDLHYKNLLECAARMAVLL